MKRTIYILLIQFLILSNLSIYSQSDGVKRKYRELETLEKHIKALEADNAKELKCKNKILDVYYNLSKEIRKKSDKLTKEQYENVKDYQKNNWSRLMTWKKRIKTNCQFWDWNLKAFREYEDMVLEHLTLTLKNDGEVYYNFISIPKLD
jgi:hypothetical protein